MISHNLSRKINTYVKKLQHYTDRSWYPLLAGFLAALDNFIVVVPNDGILISSSMLVPKRWFNLALCMSIGSTLGAVGLALLVRQHGLPWILDIYPGIDETKTWLLTLDFFNKYGLYLVFAVAATPVMQHPSVILASLASTPIIHIAAVIFIGRFIKSLIMAYVGSHTPKLLKKMWGVRGELKDVGIEISK